MRELRRSVGARPWRRVGRPHGRRRSAASVWTALGLLAVVGGTALAVSVRPTGEDGSSTVVVRTSGAGEPGVLRRLTGRRAPGDVSPTVPTRVPPPTLPPSGSPSPGDSPSAGPFPSAGPSTSHSGNPQVTGTAGPAPGSGARPSMAVGVAAYSPDDFARIAAMGLRHVRMDRPTAGTIERAREHGIEVLPIVDYGFADLSGQDSEFYPPLPSNRGAWARRMVDIWRGMPDPPRVFEVWNEPWLAQFWAPSPDASAYLELVKAFAAEAWAQWPHAVILVSADEGETGTSFRRELLAADTTGFLTDGRIRPSTHNYVGARAPRQQTPRPCSWDLTRYACAYDDFKAHGHPDPKVWVTEFGWESSTPAPGYSRFGAVSEEEQAAFTTEALDIFARSAIVEGAFAFLVAGGTDWNYNWLRPDDRPKPVADAVRRYLGG